MSGQDFSDDITNGGFENHEGDEEMLTAGTGDEFQDDSMGATNPNNNGDENRNGGEDMEHQGNGDSSAANNAATSDQKLFIGGLSWETTEKDLREYFAKFGTIESLTLKMDPATGRSRGFAFIVFSETATLDKVIEAGEHVINGKKVDPKRAKARQGKIFVGGLTQEISDDEIKTYFSQFGNVVEMEMPIDKVKNQRKGFCFITFDNEQIVQELLKTPKQTIAGKEVDVKKAQPPQNPRMMGGWGGGMGMGSRGGGGGRGAPRGRGGRGRGDWNWGGYGGQNAGGYSGGGYGQGYGGYTGAYDGYYGGGYGNYDYYSQYGGYSDYGGYDYDGTSTPSRGGRGGRGTSGAGGYSGKTRGQPRGGQPRHMPY
ncbi:RNA-binding protein squid isoform X2 [Folsomia candida]|uniref:RNA-binding protein squid isoform X2 n=1 Tax=Folsomia candida TaxID=158441 RepID=UPI000B903C83|nr:RNA-binding protein squid isoform X2 [Folsomia candida]